MVWQLCSLNTFLTLREDRFKPSDIKLKGLKRIDKIDFSGTIHLSDKPSNTDMIVVKKGDLIISGINVHKGAVAVYEGENDVTATIHYSSYTFDRNKINIDFFKLFLKSPEFLDAIREQVPGGIKTEIKAKHILPLRVAIPGIEEQKEIVNRFTKAHISFLSLSDSFNQQQKYIQELRQAFLREAMQGKLVPQDENDEPASVLLERIKAEKQKLIAEGKLKKEKPLPEIKPEEIPYILPAGWSWCYLSELCTPSRDITYGIVKLYDPVPDGVSTLRTSDIKPGYIVTENIRKVASAISDKYKRTILQGGEILFAIRGTLGGCSVVSDNMAGFNISREIALIPLSKYINNRFVLSVLLSPYIQNETLTKLRGVAYKGVNLSALRKFLIPIPPESEQKRIVNLLEKLMCHCDELEQSIKQSKEQAEMLMQAALREALKSE